MMFPHGKYRKNQQGDKAAQARTWLRMVIGIITSAAVSVMIIP